MAAQEELQRTFDRIWNEIREPKLYAGQPRSAASAQSVALSRQALQLAQDAGNERFLLESWKMLAYSLSANEQYAEAIPYYKRIIEQLDRNGDHGLAARQRIGYTAALGQTARYREGIEAAAVATRWFAEHPDEHAQARLFTNVGILYKRCDDYKRATKFYSKAADTFEKLGDKQAVAQVCLNLANVYSMIDQF